ncbi:MAG TPA: kelch repeat-containing protein, partial [Ktedonobacteraceae bacterium]
PAPGIDQGAQLWRELPSLPSPEADNTATYVGLGGRPYIYISGGNRSQNTIPDYDRALYRYDILATQWEIVTPPHFPALVNNSAVADHQGHIFFTSGYAIDLHTTSSILYEYQPGNGILRRINPPASVAIGFGDSMLIDNQDHLYITQGFMKAGNPETRAGTGWYRYDIDTGSWHKLAPFPIGLGYTLLTTDSNDSIFVFGGAIDAGQQRPTNYVYRYDIASNSWQHLPMSLPRALSGASGCIIRPGKFFVVGGYNTIQPNSQTGAWQVDLATLNWQPMPNPSFNSAEFGSAACDGNGHAYIERGGDNTRRPTSDFWEFLDTTPLQ